MQISSVSLSSGDCFPESPGFIYIRVTSTRILPTQLITANIVSVLTFLFAGESPERLCLLLVADVESHRERCQPQPLLPPAEHHSLSAASTTLYAFRVGTETFPKAILLWKQDLAPGADTGQVPGLVSGAEAQTHHHDVVAELPTSTKQLQPQTGIQHSWGQTTESVEKKGYYPCSCTERMLNSQQRLFFQSNSQVCVTKVGKESVPGALSRLDPQLFGPPFPYPCFVHFPGSPTQKD